MRISVTSLRYLCLHAKISKHAGLLWRVEGHGGEGDCDRVRQVHEKAVAQTRRVPAGLLLAVRHLHLHFVHHHQDVDS